MLGIQRGKKVELCPLLLMNFGLVHRWQRSFHSRRVLYLYETTRLLNVFKDAGGVWHEDRFRPLISALVNLSLNLAAVKYIGIYGIVLSTIVALGMIEVPWLLRNIFTVMYDSSLFKDYFKMFVSWIVATVFSCASIAVLTYKVTLSGWGAFAFFVVVSVLIGYDPSDGSEDADHCRIL